MSRVKLLSLLLLFGCNSLYFNSIACINLSAAMSPMQDTICQRDTMYFLNQSIGADSFYLVWDDGRTDSYDSGTTVFKHRYFIARTVNAKLFAFSDTCVDSVTVTFTSLRLPRIDFYINNLKGCYPLKLYGDNNSLFYNYYYLNWGDGNFETSPPADSLPHTYTAIGTYPITFAIGNGYCSDTVKYEANVTGIVGNEKPSLNLASVESDGLVYLEWEKISGANYYTLYRSSDGVNFFTRKSGIQTTNYFDNTPTDESWFYRIEAKDTCNHATQSSNVGRTILLEGRVTEENSAAVLSWNAYIDWPGGVFEYILEVKNEFGTFVPVQGQDSLYYADGEFFDMTKLEKCYRIRAIEAGGGGVSKSNEICLPYKPIFWVPNAFSPNGDGTNDVWGIESIGMETLQFTIFNRWGEKVFMSEHPSQKWDGLDAETGLYWYMVEGKGVAGKPFRKWGTLFLIR